MDDLERFTLRIVEEDRGFTTLCHIWTGAHDSYGYGQFYVNRRRAGAHRWIWERRHGPIAVGLEPDHLCRTRDCVNDAHMELVTRRENLLRGETVAAIHAAKTHCVHGHEFTRENTRFFGPDGRWRECRTCRSRSNRSRASRSRAAS